jgi:tetratricopeptide (TPR) repeat protein
LASNPRLDDLRKRFERERGSRVFAQFAEELRRAGETAEAIRVSREGLALHPSYTTARITLGRALLDGGEVEGAAREFEGVLKTTPDNLIASRYLGECLEKRGEVGAALQHYEKALLFSPGDEWIKGRMVALGSGAEGSARGGAARASGVPGAQAVVTAAGQATLRTGPIPVPSAADEEAVTLPGGTGVPARAGGVGEGVWGEPGVAEWGGTSVAEPAIASESPAPGANPPAAVSGAAEPAQTVARTHEEEEFELETAAAPRTQGERPQLTFRPLVDDEAGAAEFAQGPWMEAGEDRLPTAPLTVPESVLAWSARAAQGQEPAPAAQRQAPAAEVETIAVKATETAAADLVSPTLAELYLKQGSPARALEMYQTLLARDPGNEGLQARVAELRNLAGRSVTRGKSAGGREAQVRRAVARLEGLLAAVRSAIAAGGSRG